MLLDDMKRLSLSTAAATVLPPSSPAVSPMASLERQGTSSPSGLSHSTKSPLRRAPSSSSLGGSDRSTTPILHKRASLNSLQGTGGGTPPRSPAFRRTSSHLISSPGSGMGARSNLPPPAEETPQPPVTAASVAHDYFEKELNVHQAGASSAEEAQTIVVLQDDCYGHRFSRPRTSRANLSTIVERPERIHASIIGLAMAYVRLGGRHAEGDAAPHLRKHPSSLPSVPFKIHKTARRLSLKSPAATAIHGVKWMNELSAMCDVAESKLALNGKELSRPSTADQANGKTMQVEKPKFHEGDLYLCSESLNALEGALGGVCEGIDAVFNERGPNRAFVCIRPPGHHCSADMPSGFCWLNNVHVGIGHAVLAHGLTHTAIIDFDLHHGDGSQSITWAHNSRVGSMPKNTPLSKKTAIGYFSLHDINSYPCEMGDEEKVRNASLCIENAHGQTVWNVHLQPWKTEAEFWQLYEERYSVVLTKARNFLRLHSDRLRQAPTHPKPKAAIFLSAGFDASEWESPGMQRHQVNVPTDFYARLTRDVIMIAEEEGLGVDGRVISVLEGGYSDRALMSGVLSHVSGLASATGASRLPNLSNGLGLEMGRRLGTLDINGDSMQAQSDPRKETNGAFESDWWSLPHLEEIEALTNPPVPAAAPKKQRNDGRPTYTSATQSYTAKIVSPPQGRRSTSGSNGFLHQGESSMARAPSPPPPAVDWATAAHELSKLLIPSNRETRSCRPEDLNAEASRARRDRYSAVGLPVDVPVIDPKKMQLRDRRGKPPQYASDDEEGKHVSRASRRKTIADVSLLAEDIEPTTAPSSNTSVGQPTGQVRRRSSVASTASCVTMERGSGFSLGSANDAQIRRDPLVVKKPRAPANPRSEVPKAKAIRKQATAPRMSSVSSIVSNLDNQATSSQETNKAPLAENEDMRNKDVDQLTSGMKKISIKLNVPPKQEYEARETKPKAPPRGRAAKSTVSKPTKPVSPTKAKVKPIKETSLPKPPTSEPFVAQQLPRPALLPEPAQEILELVPKPALPEQLLQPAAQEPMEPPPTSLAPPSEPSITPHDPIAATAAGAPSTHVPDQEEIKAETPRPAPQPSMPQQQLSDFVRPETPVAAKRTKQDLPVFTTTSPISFGKSNVFASSIGQAMNSNGYAVPPSKPSIPQRFPEQPTIAGAVDREDQVSAYPPPLPEIPTTMDVKQEPHSSTSIWDVPDTPQLRKP
ncbi:hypothetical protein OEA41_003122 [Lepraria neglecta]|uniref:Histone deacetylase domain-containing protein n=1 Tax=Lepraria neglecta TaxID=209136 RepID=A0AAD9Z7U8_9LECA|nr:hypothetical protein OEA41_003122 [Lepraria neglecta]